MSDQQQSGAKPAEKSAKPEPPRYNRETLLRDARSRFGRDRLDVAGALAGDSRRTSWTVEDVNKLLERWDGIEVSGYEDPTAA